MTKEKMDKLLKELKEQLLKDFGTKCKSFSTGCLVCQVWHGYQIIHQTYGLYSHLTPDFPALKRANKRLK